MKYSIIQSGLTLLFALSSPLLLAAEATTGADKLSPAAERGKAEVGICLGCHNEALDPPLAPPLFGVQRRYKMMFPEKQDFVGNMVAFVSNPQIDRAIMRRPVRKLGLMPAMALPEDKLNDIATYLYEVRISYPCRHWEIAVNNAEKKGQVDPHIQKDKQMLSRFCR